MNKDVVPSFHCFTEIHADACVICLRESVKLLLREQVQMTTLLSKEL